MCILSIKATTHKAIIPLILKNLFEPAPEADTLVVDFSSDNSLLLAPSFVATKFMAPLISSSTSSRLALRRAASSSSGIGVVHQNERDKNVNVDGQKCFWQASTRILSIQTALQIDLGDMHEK